MWGKIWVSLAAAGEGDRTIGVVLQTVEEDDALND
jgi:hypothetical protein